MYNIQIGKRVGRFLIETSIDLHLDMYVTKKDDKTDNVPLFLEYWDVCYISQWL